ncbi:MAG: hypothetical protein HKN04_11145, partial [Rhodothermaceae bacterium]|nr:hypothetical protein [Rhodothermaceae bacterium]
RLFLDPVSNDRERAARKYQLSDDYRWWVIPTAVGVAGIALALVGLFTDAPRFFYAYLIGWVFCVSIAIGALFFVMIQHITKARWSASLRRIPELIGANMPLLALLGIPLLFGLHDLYHWTHAELYDPASPEYDSILAGKQAYLNMPFFLARLAVYFLVWSYLGRRLYALSVRQDTEPNVENTLKLRFVSAWGIPVLALTTAFASYDLLMSLDPHWFSTIFGVYFFAGGWLASLSLIVVLGLTFRRAGLLEYEITTEHYHDVGKFMFGFVVFWTYIAFSQYMLIWYGDLPEETRWFMDRYTNGWDAVTWGLIIGHFILPFFLLLPRFAKRILPYLAIMAVWLLVMHWYDLFWQAMPTLYAEAGHAAEAAGHAVGAAQHGEAVIMEGTVDFEAVSHSGYARFALTDFGAWLGLFGLFLGATLWRAGRHSLTPYNDPYYADALRFENV